MHKPERDRTFFLDLHAGESRIPLSQRIFVNRNLKMQTIRSVGFDMDHTLAVYKKEALENLAFEATLQKLIEEKNYPESIASLKYDPDLIIRGLVVDKHLGNLLKIDQYNYVVRVYHGTRLLGKEQRKHLYRNRRIRLSSEKYMSIDTLFGLPEATLFAQLVDHFELYEKTPWNDYTWVYDDVRECIDRAHADNTIKKEIIAEPSRFIIKDDRLATTLESFLAQGKRLFLLTNSEAYYTQRVMQFLLDGVLSAYPSWRDYFSVVVVSARKPRFFYFEGEPVPLTAEELRAADMEALQRPIYQGGGAQGLETLVGHQGDEILYVGDHTFGDILRAKKGSRWRTAMVIEELGKEIEQERALASDYRGLDELVAKRNKLLFQIDRLRKRSRQANSAGNATGSKPRVESGAGSDIIRPAQELENRLQQLEEEGERLRVTIRERNQELEGKFNRHWGKLFKCGEINSRFGHQVKDFACIYTSAVSNFLPYPESMYFRSPREIMPHEMGLHS